jgi:hypothetical protein
MRDWRDARSAFIPGNREGVRAAARNTRTARASPYHLAYARVYLVLRSRILGWRARDLYRLARGPTNPTGARDGTRAEGVCDRRRRFFFVFLLGGAGGELPGDRD